MTADEGGLADGTGDAFARSEASDGDPRSDADLIALMRGRGADRESTEAFGTLYRRHERAARALARQLARSPADAAPLFAGAFTRMLGVLRAGRGPSEAFRAYLLTSVRNLAYDRTRAERRVDLTEDYSDVTGAEGTVIPFQDSALAGLERTLAARAFATLPERWQAVLWHLEVEGDSPADIAPLFGLSPNAVSALGYRAREGLRQAYLQEHLASSQGHRDRRHRETGEKLGAYTRGGLAKRDAARVETHLGECEECRELARELREVNAGLVRSVVAPLVLGAGLIGYLASRGGGAPFALDASTGELAVVGGGALGVVGALLGAPGLGRSGLEPPGTRPVPTPRRLVAVGAVGLAGAVGIAAFAVGDAVRGAGAPEAALVPPALALPGPSSPPRAPAPPPGPLDGVLPPTPADLGVPGGVRGTDDPGATDDLGATEGVVASSGAVLAAPGPVRAAAPTTATSRTSRTPPRETTTTRAPSSARVPLDARTAGDCALTVQLPVVGSAGVMCPNGTSAGVTSLGSRR